MHDRRGDVAEEGDLLHHRAVGEDVDLVRERRAHVVERTLPHVERRVVRPDVIVVLQAPPLQLGGQVAPLHRRAHVGDLGGVDRLLRVELGEVDRELRDEDAGEAGAEDHDDAREELLAEGHLLMDGADEHEDDCHPRGAPPRGEGKGIALEAADVQLPVVGGVGEGLRAREGKPRAREPVGDEEDCGEGEEERPGGGELAEERRGAADERLVERDGDGVAAGQLEELGENRAEATLVGEGAEEERGGEAG
mmetsp:Transcript_28309/g.65104  ORF Transcript_28309/g.65104 Transcript_28309/m.65104 type:complete len:251 (-) Transcript_28309:655-1407(-)